MSLLTKLASTTEIVANVQVIMDAQEAQTLQLHDFVVWTPDGMKGEVIAKDGSGVKIRWEDGQFGYYQFTDLLSQIERSRRSMVG